MFFGATKKADPEKIDLLISFTVCYSRPVKLNNKLKM